MLEVTDVRQVSPGLCSDCIHARSITSDKGSIFIQCLLSFSDPQFAKYPRLPVLTCNGYSTRDEP